MSDKTFRELTLIGWYLSCTWRKLFVTSQLRQLDLPSDTFQVNFFPNIPNKTGPLDILTVTFYVLGKHMKLPLLWKMTT